MSETTTIPDGHRREVPLESMRVRTSMRVLATVAWLAASLVSGCAYYSFTGATIPAHLSTVAIPLAEDRSVSTFVGLDERLTSLLVERFVGQTRLSLDPVAANADALLTVVIERYQNQPTSVGGGERATRNRVTVSARVVYRDQVKNEDLLTRSFSAFEEFEADDPTQEEAAAIAALSKIADDVFTAATSNW